MTEFRVYVPAEVGGTDLFDAKGYPLAWQEIKNLVREQAGNRCIRCRHPYEKGMGEWSPCDDECFRSDYHEFGAPLTRTRYRYDGESGEGIEIVEAAWRVLTVHHLDGVKANCRWWNLVSLCQRCHLNVQRRVVLDRPWPWPHSDWFQVYAAAFYAVKYLDADLPRDEAEARLEELLALGAEREKIERMPV